MTSRMGAPSGTPRVVASSGQAAEGVFATQGPDVGGDVADLQHRLLHRAAGDEGAGPPAPLDHAGLGQGAQGPADGHAGAVPLGGEVGLVGQLLAGFEDAGQDVLGQPGANCLVKGQIHSTKPFKTAQYRAFMAFRPMWRPFSTTRRPAAYTLETTFRPPENTQVSTARSSVRPVMSG
jgi:hypothetical protein